jgi:hypothetical protein
MPAILSAFMPTLNDTYWATNITTIVPAFKCTVVPADPSTVDSTVNLPIMSTF